MGFAGVLQCGEGGWNGVTDRTEGKRQAQALTGADPMEARWKLPF